MNGKCMLCGGDVVLLDTIDLWSPCTIFYKTEKDGREFVLNVCERCGNVTVGPLEKEEN